MLKVINKLYELAYRDARNINYTLFREASELLNKYTPTLREEGRLEEHPWYDHRREFAYA